jgi:SAM-dependent methyltransferase
MHQRQAETLLMFSLFKKDRDSSLHADTSSGQRHSRGWGGLLKHLKTSDALRVLDFGATSPANINYLTSLGHSVYMANIVQDATRAEWYGPAEDAPDGPPQFDVEHFVAANLDFSGRDFDVILLWDTANYLPPSMVPALFRRLREVLRPDGRLLAFFHGKNTGPQTAFSRYQLTDNEDLLVHPSGNFPVLQVYQTRQVEKFLDGYSSIRFFLSRDNVREVIAIR